MSVYFVGKGAGLLSIRAIYDSIIQSEIYSLYDCIYYDGGASDTNANYYLNTLYGTSITYDSANHKLTVTCGSDNTKNYLDLRTGNTALDLNALKGKTVRFKVYVENTAQKNLQLRVYNNTTTIASSDMTRNSGELYVDVEIPNDSTLLIFRIAPSQSANIWLENDTYSFKNFEIYPI